MRLVLDSGAVTALAGDRARLAELARRGLWPPLVPVVVLAEALTGDHRRDHSANRLLAMSDLVTVDESLARSAAWLRTSSGRGGRISAVDAVVAAVADTDGDSVVLTADMSHLRALSAVAEHGFGVASV